MPAIKREIARNRHSTGPIRFGLVFLLALALSACGSATPAVISSATPMPPSATMLAPTITQPTETTQPIFGEGIVFTLVFYTPASQRYTPRA
jgi:hypothetical protein